MAVTTAAVVGAGAAVAGAANSRKAAKDATKSQERQNEANRDFIESQIGQAREDAASLFPAAELNLLAGQQAALDVFGQSAPQQVQAIQAGSDAARQAILGTGTGEVGFTPDISFMQQILPTLRAPDQRFGSAALVPGSPVEAQPVTGADAAPVVPEYLQGLATNEDLFLAAATGQIPGLSGDEQNFWRAHLANLRGQAQRGIEGAQESLTSDNWLANPQGAMSAIVGQPGGFRPRNEMRTSRLLDVIINPYTQEELTGTSAAGRFLGGA